MAVTTKLYGHFPYYALCKQITDMGATDLTGTTLKAALVTSSYTFNQDTHEDWADITNEISGTGYTAGGETITFTGTPLTFSGGITTFDCDNIEWASSTFTARGCVVYDATPAVAGDRRLIAFIDFGEDVSVTDDTFSIMIASTGLFTFTVADATGTTPEIVIFGQFPLNALRGLVSDLSEEDLDTTLIYCALASSSYTPDQDTHTSYNDLTDELATGDGYTAHGDNLGGSGVALTYSSRVTSFGTGTTLGDAAWTSSTLTARYGFVYDYGISATHTLQKAIAYVDFGVDYASSSSTFTITWPSTGLFTFTVAA
jgi:hypothetical protein